MIANEASLHIAHSYLTHDYRSRVTHLGNVQQLEGRVLGHEEEESTGRTYMILEGTDRNIHFIYRSDDLDAARRQGKLKPNSFVRLTTLVVNRKFATKVQYFGNCGNLVLNKHYFRNAVQQLMRQGLTPLQTEIGGWADKPYKWAAANMAEPDRVTV